MGLYEQHACWVLCWLWRDAVAANLCCSRSVAGQCWASTTLAVPMSMHSMMGMCTVLHTRYAHKGFSVSSLPSKSMIYNLNLITAPSLSAYIQI